MSIYSTVGEVTEGNYTAFIQSVGFSYISHIDITDNKTNDRIWMNENQVELLKFVLNIKGSDNPTGDVTKNDFICTTSNGASIFHLLATKEKVVLYDDSGILYFDMNTFLIILQKISDIIAENYKKIVGESVK